MSSFATEGGLATSVSAYAPAGASSVPIRRVLSRALHPPVRDLYFWAIQASVLALTALHLWLDEAHVIHEVSLVSLPVALLFIPVTYAALRFGLHGSAATALWATVLWMPNLALAGDHRDAAADLVSLALVDAVALVVGQRIEREGMALSAASLAAQAQRLSDARYRQIFASTGAPILVFHADGRTLDANPAAWALFGPSVLDTDCEHLLQIAPDDLAAHRGPDRVPLRSGGNQYEFRCITSLVEADKRPHIQVLLQDVTAERRAWKDAQEFAAALLAAQEEERARIAREIHDDPLQRLLGVARRLELFTSSNHIDKADAERISNLRQELLTTSRTLRDLAQGLRPPALEHLGLAAALRGLLSDEEERAPWGPRLDLSIHGSERRLSPECELGLYRIAQEALNNAVTHAEPEHVRVELAFWTSSVRLTIWNNGGWFDPDASPVKSQLGLRGMRERASLLGGKLEIFSSERDGTTVVAYLPIHGVATSE
ncbi:MAG: histidine kinase [Actinomycetota bacterium]|jgi:signal transduction histidine kinase|nr:histidine kinase [Actinomycetota bacterium]